MRLRRGLLLLVLLLPACGLPLPQGVRSAGSVPDEAPRGGPVVVLPPGPGRNASATEIVLGFLAAQSSGEDDYAVARQFLAEGVSWDPATGVEVYDPARPPVVDQAEPPSEGPSPVVVVSQRVAQVRQDGGYRRAGGEVVDDYEVSCRGDVCRITALPEEYGLRLSSRDLAGSFAPRSTYFLGPSLRASSPQGHLVADLVWMPRGEGLAGRLVRAVLDGPSAALGDSVRSALPPGVELRSVRSAPDGTVTVDLTGPLREADPLALEQLSAQLVWTLRELGGAFARLRLQADGSDLAVDGRTEPQPAASWAEYTPERLRPRAPVFYVQDRTLRSLDGGLASSPATAGMLPVDAVAVSPDGFLALLSQQPDGTSALFTGPQSGPFGEARTTGTLSAPSWGSGEQGVWLVRDGTLLLVPQQGRARAVPVDGLQGRGRLREVRVARDGVRVALLAGSGSDPSLLVGRLRLTADGPVVGGVREIVPGLREVVDVAWESGVSLVVLARSPFGRLPTRLAVDGSAAGVVGARLPEGVEPQSLTAAVGRPLVLAGRLGEVGRLYREQGQVFGAQDVGSAPAYPG